MNKKRLTILISLAAISIISLIAIQIYWIRTSVAAQREQFDQTVMKTMHGVVKKIEREEAITKVTRTLLNGDELFEGLRTTPSIKVENNSQNEEQTNNFETPTIVKTHSDQLQLKIKSPPNNDSSYFIIRQTQKRMLGSSVNDEIGTDSLIANQLKKNATLLNDFVNELALITISKNKTDDISFEKIDSLFASELMANGLKTEYLFDILDVETNRLTFSEDGHETSELRDTPYKLSLFPNAFLMESDYLLLYFPDQNSYIVKNSWEILLISFILVCILIFLFYSSISTIYKQKKLSQVKNDFINNMTHELKTPISTISLACEALTDKSLQLDNNRRSSYVDMIQDENKRLSVLVDNVLKSAVWDSTELQLTFKKWNLHDLIAQVANSFDIQINKRQGSLQLHLNALSDEVIADRVHLSNVIFNLLDNANKYSPDSPQIELTTKNQGSFIIFSISDKGIGISKENQRKIFDKFYRVSTGNIHDVKGFGLGLNYVKRIVELHDGEINIDSNKEIGTTINIKLNTNGR